MVKRFEIYMLNMDAQIGKDPRNTRPCIVISPDEMNRHLETAIIAPISAEGFGLPTRVPVQLLEKERFAVLDQIRTVETERLFKKIGEGSEITKKRITDTLQELFAE